MATLALLVYAQKTVGTTPGCGGGCASRRNPPGSWSVS